MIEISDHEDNADISHQPASSSKDCVSSDIVALTSPSIVDSSLGAVLAIGVQGTVDHVKHKQARRAELPRRLMKKTSIMCKRPANKEEDKQPEEDKNLKRTKQPEEDKKNRKRTNVVEAASDDVGNDWQTWDPEGEPISCTMQHKTERGNSFWQPRHAKRALIQAPPSH